MPDPGVAERLRQHRRQKQAVADYDRMIGELGPELQKTIERAGQNWWVKPSVLTSLIEASATEEDLNFVGGLAAQLGQPAQIPGLSILGAPTARANAEWQKKWDALQEIARKKADEGFQWGDVLDVAKGTARAAGSILESGYQEAQGVFRGVADTLHPGSVSGAVRSASSGGLSGGGESGFGEGFVGSQSTFGITLEKLFKGEISPGEVVFGDPDATGSGWLTGGEVASEQSRRAFRSASIDGHALTPGRLVAHEVAEPGEWQHKWLSGAIDGGLIIYADPLNPVLGAVGKAVKSRRYFQADDGRRLLGLVQGQRKTVTESVQHWLTSTRSGARFVDTLTELDDPVEIWERSRRQIPIEWAVKIADEGDRAAVLDLTRGFLGTDVVAKPRGWHYTRGGALIRSRTVRNPILGQMPRTGRLDTYDPEAFVTQLADELKNAHVPDEEARGIVRNAMHAATSGPPGTPLASERYSVLSTAKDAVAAQLRAAGVETPKAAELTRIWNSYDALRRYNIDVMTGVENPLPWVVANGEQVRNITPQTLEQLLGRYVPLADAITLRKISARTGWLSKLPAGQTLATARIGAGLAADAFNKLWKPLQLIRIAYIARVVGDEQARMAAAGLSSMFSSPISYFALAIMDDGRLGKVVDNFAGVGRYGAEVTGEKFATRAPKIGGRMEAVVDDSDFADTMYRGTTDLLFGREARSIRAPGFISIGVEEEGFFDAWVDELRFLYDDQVARRIASGEPIDDIKEWYYTSGRRAATIGSGDATRFPAGSPGAEASEKLSPLAKQVSTRQGSDEYVEHMREWVEGVTQGDSALIEAVATGRLPVGATHAKRADKLTHGTAIHRNSKPTKEARDYVLSLAAAGTAPEFVRGSPLLQVSQSKAATDAYRDTIDFLMDIVAVRPSNWASRSPTFRQFYWRRVEELFDMVDDTTRAKVLEVAANEAKLPKAAIKKLEKIPAAGELDLEDLNALASQYAADQTKKLLYDLHNRSRFFDAARIIFPFGEAWLEVLKTWGKLVTENPRSLRTLQKTVTGARGAGLVYEDPTTGEEMFTFPGSRELTRALTGVDADFRATTAGLSIAGSVLPGVGPAVQWGVGTFLPDKPRYKWARDIAFQFGGEDEGFIKTLTPGWAEKLQKWAGGPESDRQFNNAVGEALNALASTGDYDLQDDADLERLQSDAVEAAKRIWGLRGIFQFIAPSAPQPRVFIETTKGSQVRAVLTEEFYRLQQVDYETAVEKFVERFGPLALIATVPYTRTEEGGRPVLGLRPTEKFNDFESTHGGLFKSFPHVAGLFGPQDAGYDFQVYERQARLYRESKTQTERLEDYNHMLGQMAFDSYKGQLPANPSAAQRRWLADWKRELMAEYPGFGSRPLNITAVEANVNELARAAAHESLADNDLAEAVRRYMGYRAKAIEASPSTGWNQANSARPLRDWLREWAEEISTETPEFRRIWDVLLSRELNDDLEAEQEAA